MAMETALMMTIDDLRAQNEKMREALEKFADERNWIGDLWAGHDNEPWIIAQEALK